MCAAVASAHVCAACAAASCCRCCKSTFSISRARSCSAYASICLQPDQTKSNVPLHEPCHERVLANFALVLSLLSLWPVEGVLVKLRVSWQNWRLFFSVRYDRSQTKRLSVGQKRCDRRRCARRTATRSPRSSSLQHACRAYVQLWVCTEI